MPPTRNAAATRERLLAAARGRFLQESYDGVGLREVAREAGVDVALIARYFGSKEELFRAVLHSKEGNWGALALAADDLPSTLAEMLSDRSRDAEHVDRLLIMLRSAASPQAASIVASAFREDVLDPLAKVVGGADAEARAALALSILMGTKVVRTLMKLEDAYRCDAGSLQTRLADILSLALAPLNEGSN